MTASDQTRFDDVQARLRKHGQEHLLAHWETLSEAQRAELLDDIERINLPAVSRLIESHVKADASFQTPDDIQPAPFFPAEPDMDLVGKYADAVKRGISLIRGNKVAAFTVAGGQGTRLGFDGPKGAFPASPVKNKPLFELFADFILGADRRYGAQLHWFIMTSPQNDAETRDVFRQNDNFGLDPGRVHFFQQGVMPAFGFDGRILLDQKHRIAFSPDGHGGSLLALRRSGALATMQELGIEHISYIQVDNPLVKLIDPLFIGLHALTKSEMSSKTIPKVDDLERVGNFVIGDGTLQVIEYSDLPDELARAKDADGNRRFDAGSIAIHVISRAFVEKLTDDPDAFGLPWHRAVKKVPCIHDNGARVEPDQPNAVKLETFIFDAIPLAGDPMVLQTIRAEEFSPIKNAEGTDSPATSRRDQSRRAARWLQQAGFAVPRKADGEPDGTFEISSRLALDAEHLREQMTAAPELASGKDHYWE